MNVCMYVCIYECLYAFMYVYKYECVCVWIYWKCVYIVQVSSISDL